MLAQKNYDGAIKYFSAAMKADPQNAGAYRGLGLCYAGKSDMAHSAQYLEYALRKNPADDQVRQTLGKIYQSYGNDYYKRGNKANAVAWWNKAVKVDPGNTQLAAYLQTVSPAAAPAAPATAMAPAAAPAPASAAPAQSVGPTPGINPWIMGATVAALGAIMLFVF
jgi:tetratricopeptide (TPR) repeat protein